MATFTSGSNRRAHTPTRTQNNKWIDRQTQSIKSKVPFKWFLRLKNDVKTSLVKNSILPHIIPAYQNIFVLCFYLYLLTSLPWKLIVYTWELNYPSQSHLAINILNSFSSLSIINQGSFTQTFCSICALHKVQFLLR